MKGKVTNTGSSAILVTGNGQIIAQQRSLNPGILNSGKIGFFGGVAKPSENPKSCLRRELLEELELDITKLPFSPLGTYSKTVPLDGTDHTTHIFIVAGVTFEDLRLHEGAGFIIDTAQNLLRLDNLTRITRLALEDYVKKYT